MNTKIRHSQLVAQVLDSGRKSIEARQVGRRLDRLLPERLKELIAQQRGSCRGGHAERLALTDHTYRAYVEELITIRAAGLEARIQHETHFMLLEARRTLGRRQS